MANVDARRLHGDPASGSGDGGDGVDRTMAHRHRTPAEIVPVRVAMLFMAGMFIFALGTGYMACYLIDRGLQIEVPGPPQVVNVAEGERFFVDAKLFDNGNGGRAWQIRWVEYGLIRTVVVESDIDKNRLVSWLRDGKR